MSGLNKAILIGNLGKDPELRRTPNGNSVVSFSLATTERWNDKSGGRQDRTEWHNIVAWGKLADLANQYLKKGRSVYIEGRITTRSWEDKDGNKRNRTEIVANQILFLGGSSGDSSANEAVAAANAGETYPETTSAMEHSPPVVEDDLPF